MTSTTEAEFRALLNALRDDRITPAEAERLQLLIASDDEALRLYVRYAAIEAMLRDRVAGPAAAMDDGPIAAAADRVGPADPMAAETLYGYSITPWAGADDLDEDDALAAPQVVRHPARRTGVLAWASRHRAITGLAACLIVAIALALTLRRSPGISAEVVRVVDAEWGAARPGGPRGTSLAAGAEVELRRGRADLQFRDGVTVNVFAPARFALTETGGLRLAEGRVSAEVPPAGVGFVVTTPASTVVDLGTRFGVLVERAGATEVHVLKGRVRVEPGAPGSPAAAGVQPARELGADAALRIEQGGLAVATVPVRPDRFRRGVDLVFEVPDQQIGAAGDDDGTYTEAGFRVSEVSFTGLNIKDGMLQDGGWGGGFELASTKPGEGMSLLSFEARTRYGNPGGVTVLGYDGTNPDPVTSQAFALTGETATYTLDASFNDLSRVMFRNESDPEFNSITVTTVPEPQAGYARPVRDPRRARGASDDPYPRRPPQSPQQAE